MPGQCYKQLWLDEYAHTANVHLTNALTIFLLAQGGDGLQLTGPRLSLGVETVGDAFFVLLPFSVCTPCSAKQVFTTCHDNQSEVTPIVVHFHAKPVNHSS